MLKVINFFKQHYLIVLILILAFFIRIFRIETLTTFGGDQGIDLLVVKQMLVEHRWTLLGPKTSIAPVFNGPIYYYFLLPFLFIFRLDPLGASYFMILCYLGTIFFLYLFGCEFINKKAALLSALFFAIWPISVEYSRVSFNSFPTPFFAMLFIYGLFKAKKNYLWLILSGIALGIMMQLHYFNFFLGFLGFLYLIYQSSKKIKSITFFITFFLIGFLPMIAFELRHQFFNAKNLWFFLQQKGAFGFEWQLHYFIAFSPVVFLLLGFILDWFWRKNKIAGSIVILLLTFLNIFHLDFSRKNGYTMPEGWNLPGVRKAVDFIIQEQKENNNEFNIAALLDGDTRGYPYRYLLSLSGQKLLGVEDYPKSKVLYVIGRGDSPKILSYPVWEINSFLPARIEKTWEIQNGVQLFKLIKK